MKLRGWFAKKPGIRRVPRNDYVGRTVRVGVPNKLRKRMAGAAR